MQDQLEFLDILSIISFVLTVQNQSKLIGIQDVQKELDRVLDELQTHLQTQDDKIDKILEVLNENHKEDS